MYVFIFAIKFRHNMNNSFVNSTDETEETSFAATFELISKYFAALELEGFSTLF